MKAICIPDVTVRCTICGRPLRCDVQGVRSHLRRHINHGELAKRDEIETAATITHMRVKPSAIEAQHCECDRKPMPCFRRG
jgi:hypothetical protein